MLLAQPLWLCVDMMLCVSGLPTRAAWLLSLLKLLGWVVHVQEPGGGLPAWWVAAHVAVDSVCRGCL